MSVHHTKQIGRTTYCKKSPNAIAWHTIYYPTDVRRQDFSPRLGLTVSCKRSSAIPEIPRSDQNHQIILTLCLRVFFQTFTSFLLDPARVPFSSL